MMMKFFVPLSLISFLTISSLYAVAPEAKPQVESFSSSKLDHEIIPPSTLFTRMINDIDDIRDYSWSGTNRNETVRSTIIFDDLFNQVQSWGEVPFYLVRFSKRSKEFQLSKTFYNPPASINPDEVRQNYPGAYILKRSCLQTIEKRQHELNVGCASQTNGKCNDVFIGLNLFGIFGKMNWKKDGFLFRTCSIVKTKSDFNCLIDFPFSSSCQIKFIEDHTPSANIKTNKQSNQKFHLIQSGKSSTYSNLIKLIQIYSQKTRNSFTLPNGSLINIQQWNVSGNEA